MHSIKRNGKSKLKQKLPTLASQDNGIKTDIVSVVHLSFVDCESFLESNSPDVLALCEANLDGSIDSGNFSVRGYLPLIQKDSAAHMHGLAVYVKGLISTKLYRFSLMFLTGFTSLSYLLLSHHYGLFLVPFHLT